MKRMIERLLVPRISYPQAFRDETLVYDYHGTQVRNPYEWLEDPDSEKTADFVTELNKVSSAYINQCSIKDKIRNGLKDIINYPKYSCPRKEGNFYFYSYNTGLQNQNVLYKLDRLDGEPTVFLDPNTLSEDGTVALTQKSFTDDGSLIAYGLSGQGSDWVTVKIKRTEDGSDLPDKLERLRYTSLAWTHDNNGLFYNKYADECANAVGRNANKNEYHRLYYHYLGKPQCDDILCVEFQENPNYMIGAEVSDDGNFLVVDVNKGCDPQNLIYFYDLKNSAPISGKLSLTPIIDRFESKFSFIANDGFVFTFLTDYNAPMFQLVQIDARNPDKANWKFLIKEENNKLDWAVRVNGNFLILCYIEDVKSVLRVHDFKTGKHLFNLPQTEIGSITQFSGKEKLSELFYMVQTFLSPGTMYHIDLAQSEKVAKIFRQVKANGIDPNDFTVKQIFYHSKDQTRVPMFIFHKKNLTPNGTTPTLLYGYGGFNSSMLPYFSTFRSFFARHFDGVVAIANIRGGDEYGEKWHQGGMKDKKQNVFDDFISAAEYLIKENYTSPEKLIIEGHSNGGLLVAACLNQRPDLFGCVLAHVGVMDMMRYHQFTIGEAWVPEYGCSKVKKEFEYLIKYSPLHNLRAPLDPVNERYPAVLLTTADHDDRVVPSHSLKYMAQVYHLWRQIDSPRLPILARVDVKAGHGSGKPTSKVIDEGADVFSFVANVLDLKWVP